MHTLGVLTYPSPFCFVVCGKKWSMRAVVMPCSASYKSEQIAKYKEIPHYVVHKLNRILDNCYDDILFLNMKGRTLSSKCKRYVPRKTSSQCPTKYYNTK